MHGVINDVIDGACESLLFDVENVFNFVYNECAFGTQNKEEDK